MESNPSIHGPSGLTRRCKVNDAAGRLFGIGRWVGLDASITSPPHHTYHPAFPHAMAVAKKGSKYAYSLIYLRDAHTQPTVQPGVTMEGIKGARGAGQLLLALLLVLVVVERAGGEAMPSHTFVAPFNEVQVDGKRLVSTYVMIDFDLWMVRLVGRSMLLGICPPLVGG